MTDRNRFLQPQALLLLGCALAVAAACGVDQTTGSSSALSSAVVAASSATATLLCAPTAAQTAACAGKAAADACTLTAAATGLPADAAGTCRATINGSGVACVPTPPAPPAEVVAACAGKAAADACTFTEPDGDVKTGACGSPPGGTVLACHPVRVPPQAAIDACASKVKGDACALPPHGHETTSEAGTCGLGPTGAGPLACQHAQDALPDATAACASLAAGAACTLGDGHRESVTGSCVVPAAGGAAVCVVSCAALGHGHGQCGADHGHGDDHGDDHGDGHGHDGMGGAPDGGPH